MHPFFWAISWLDRLDPGRLPLQKKVEAVWQTQRRQLFVCYIYKIACSGPPFLPVDPFELCRFFFQTKMHSILDCKDRNKRSFLQACCTHFKMRRLDYSFNTQQGHSAASKPHKFVSRVNSGPATGRGRHVCNGDNDGNMISLSRSPGGKHGPKTNEGFECVRCVPSCVHQRYEKARKGNRENRDCIACV